MTSPLQILVGRTLGTIPVLRPRRRSRFEPIAPLDRQAFDSEPTAMESVETVETVETTGSADPGAGADRDDIAELPEPPEPADTGSMPESPAHSVRRPAHDPGRPDRSSTQNSGIGQVSEAGPDRHQGRSVPGAAVRDGTAVPEPWPAESPASSKGSAASGPDRSRSADPLRTRPVVRPKAGPETLEATDADSRVTSSTGTPTRGRARDARSPDRPATVTGPDPDPADPGPSRSGSRRSAQARPTAERSGPLAPDSAKLHAARSASRQGETEHDELGLGETGHRDVGRRDIGRREGSRREAGRSEIGHDEIGRQSGDPGPPTPADAVPAETEERIVERVVERLTVRSRHEEIVRAQTHPPAPPPEAPPSTGPPVSLAAYLAQRGGTRT